MSEYPLVRGTHQALHDLLVNFIRGAGAEDIVVASWLLDQLKAKIRRDNNA